MILSRDSGSLQFTNGISSLVHFGIRIPTVENSTIEELQNCFDNFETMPVLDHISPADEVSVVDGAFAGMNAVVLRVLPARRRVQILLDILGRPTPVEVDRASLMVTGAGVASMVPLLILALGLLMIQRHLQDRQITAAAEVDAALLSDDLPPQAYTDPGFAEFLRRNNR